MGDLAHVAHRKEVRVSFSNAVTTEPYQVNFLHGSPSEKLVYIEQTTFRGGKREQSAIHATALVWLEEMFLNPYNCF